jgi:hypothetical protein
MVAFHDGHEHEDGHVCPGCRFKAVLAEHLEWAAHDGDESWHDLTGELMVLMGTAISMLTALRLAAAGDHPTPDNTATAAASAISRLGGVIDETWHALMDDDSQGDDADAAL